MKLSLSEGLHWKTYLKRPESLLLTRPASPEGCQGTLTRPWEGSSSGSRFLFSAQETDLLGFPRVTGCPHPRPELEGLTGAAYFQEGGQEKCPSLHVGHGHDHCVQKDDPHPSPGRRPQTLSGRPGESWGRRWGVEIGEGGDVKGGGGRTKRTGAGLGVTERRGGGRRAREGEGSQAQQWPSGDEDDSRVSRPRQRNHGGFRLKKPSCCPSGSGGGRTSAEAAARGGGGGRGAEGGPKAAHGGGRGAARAGGGTVRATGGLGTP